LSSNDFSDCSTILKSSDSEVHTKFKLRKRKLEKEKAVTLTAISSDNENLEINNSKQITDYNKKKNMKSPITYEAKINEENQNILSFKTNTQNSAEKEDISHCIFRLLHFKLKFMQDIEENFLF